MSTEQWCRRRSTRRQFLTASAGALVGASALGGLAACGGGGGSSSPAASVEPTIKAVPDGDITYFTWAEFIDPKLVKGFEAEYGVKVKQTFFSSDEAMVQKVASGLPYDVITSNSAYLERMLAANLLQPLNHEELKNLSALVPFFQDPPYDPGAKFTVPYGYGPTGIGWRADRLSPDLFKGSWNDLWDLAPKAKGKTYVLDQIEEALGASLLRLGYELNSDNDEQLNEAGDELIKLKPYLAGFSTDDYANLANGQAWLHQAWSGDCYWAAVQLEDPKKVGFEVTSEGVPLGVDCMSIGAKAAAPGTALLFVDWILDPEHSVQNVQYHGYPCGTTVGNAAVDEMLKDFPYINMPSNLLDSCLMKEAPSGARLQKMNRIWTRVKAS